MIRLRPVDNGHLYSAGYQKVVAFYFHAWNKKHKKSAKKSHFTLTKSSMKRIQTVVKVFRGKQARNKPFCPLGSVWQLRGNNRTVEIGLSNWNRQLFKTSRENTKHTLNTTRNTILLTSVSYLLSYKVIEINAQLLCRVSSVHSLHSWFHHHATMQHLNTL